MSGHHLGPEVRPGAPETSSGGAAPMVAGESPAQPGREGHETGAAPPPLRPGGPLAWLRRAVCPHRDLQLTGFLGDVGAVQCRCGWTRVVLLPPRAEQVRAMVRQEFERARLQAVESAAAAEGRPLSRLERLKLKGSVGLLWGGKRGGR